MIGPFHYVRLVVNCIGAFRQKNKKTKKQKTRDFRPSMKTRGRRTYGRTRSGIFKKKEERKERGKERSQNESTNIWFQDKSRDEDFQTGFAKMANAMYLKDKDQDGNQYAD